MKVQFAGVIVSALVLGVLTACQGGKLAGLETSGSGTLKVKKKSTKDQQIEAIKAEMAREGVNTEQATAVEEALAGVAEVEDPAEQAGLLLVALTEALASPDADEKLKEQMAHVVMGAAAELGLSLSRDGAPDLEADVRESLLETAAASLGSRDVPASAIVAAASRQLLEEPGATTESVTALVKAVPTVAALPVEEVTQLVTVEKEKKEALTRSCLDTSDVTFGREYYCPDGSRRVGAKPLCTQDGEVGCVTTADFKPTAVATLPGKVLLGQTVAGEAGLVRLPDPAKVLSGERFGALDNFAGTYSPDFPDAANVRTNDTTNGVTGTYVPDFPAASSVLTTDTTDGVTGTVVLPTAAQVQTGVTFGAAGGLTGTHDGVKANCTTDGDTDCTVPPSGTIKAADTSGFSEWDIRKKRDAGGNVMTFAGLSGKSKTCRNRVNLSVFNNATAPADSSALVPDFFDTIDDLNNNLVGIPLEYPDWTIPGVSGTHGEDFACGGIFATGLTTGGFTGADGSLAHDPDGNWKDLTPGIVPGGANSTNTNPGCNATDKFCVFRELISGLMVTEVSATTYTWQNAINYCHNLGETVGVITSPIPTLDVGLGTAHSDWRLPTQKELMHLYNAGIRGLNQTAGLVTLFGDVDNTFWSASSVSNSASDAWNVFLSSGNVLDLTKTDTYRLVCVQ